MTVQKALSAIAQGYYVFPVKPDTKTPYANTRGHLAATLDHEQIAIWWSMDYPEAFVGIACGPSGIVVADLDRKNGKDGFKSIADAGVELPPTFHYTTRSGGEHWIYAWDGPSSPTQNHRGLEGVDRRGGSSYIVLWSDDVPERSALNVPPDWLVNDPPAEDVDHDGFTGTAAAWLALLEQGDPSPKVRRLIDDIPTADFGHQEMTSLVWRAVRLGAENHPGVDQALEALYAAWARPPYESYGPAMKTALRGAIAKAGKPEPKVPALMPRAEVDRLVSPALGELILSHPPTRTDEGYAERRKRIAVQAAAERLSDSAALSLVWNSPAGQHVQERPDAVESIWREVVAAQAEYRASQVVEAAPAIVADIKILSRAERNWLAAEDDVPTLGVTQRQRRSDWWGTRYLSWVRSRVEFFNAPIHRAAMWAIASTVASPWGYIPVKGPRPMNTALYFMVPAQSTIGKSEALDFISACINAYYGRKSGVNIGTLGKLTANGLHKVLIARDGQPSFAHSDEAQAFFREISKKDSWQGSLLGDLAAHYGGIVGAKQMTGDKEHSGIEAETYLTVYATGIDFEMFDAMDLSMWTSGLFHRFVWAIADPRQPDPYVEQQADGANGGDYDAMPMQWAAEFSMAANLNGGTYRPVPMDKDALKRHGEFRRQVNEALVNHPRYEKIFVAALQRFANSVKKCATLIALLEASPTVTLRHELIALEQAEEWLSALVKMVDATGESKFDRDVAELGQWLAEKPRSEAEVFRAFRPAEYAERQLRQLEREGRVVRSKQTSGAVMIQVAEG